MDENDIQILPDDNSVTITLKEVQQNFKYDKKNTICLFIMQVIGLKTDINAKELEFKCKVEGTQYRNADVKPGTFEPHAYMMIASIKLFIDWYTKNYDSLVATHIEKRLWEKRDDLFFSGIKVTPEGGDFSKLREIIDSLCVKFYQELLLALTEAFALKHQAIIVSADVKENGYTFSFRNYNIMELDMLKKMGQLPVNMTN